MDDKTFINHFLDTNFEVKLVDGQPVIFDLYESNIRGVSEVKFIARVSKIFGTFITDDGTLLHHLAKRWLKDAYGKLILGYKSYLLECKVILTINGWQAVDSAGKEVNSQTLIDLYNYTGDTEEVEKYFDDWWYMKVNYASSIYYGY